MNIGGLGAGHFWTDYLELVSAVGCPSPWKCLLIASKGPRLQEEGRNSMQRSLWQLAAWGLAVSGRETGSLAGIPVGSDCTMLALIVQSGGYLKLHKVLTYKLHDRGQFVREHASACMRYRW